MSEPRVVKLQDNETIKFIKLYASERVLYDSTCKDYKDRDLRLAAAKRISEAMGINGFGPKEVITKFKNLRSSYCQELKKIADTERSGSGTDDVYVPKVIWFKDMNSFIRPFVQQRSTKSVGPGMESSSSSNQMATTARAQYLAMGEMSDPSATPEILPVTQEMQLEFPVTVTPHSPKRNERTRTPTDVESCYDLSYAPSYADKTEHVEDRYPDEMDHTERPAGVMEDTLNLFGRYVSSILRQLPIGKSYTLQQKFINEAISAKLEHESQYPSTPRCQNGTSPSMNNTTTAPVVVSNHTNTVVCPNTTSQRKRRKRKTSSSCAQPSSPLHIKQEVEESELSDLRGDKEITDTGTVISEDVASIEFEEGDFIGIKSEMEESDSALFTSSEHNKESRMAGSMTERLRPPPSSHCTYQTNNERVLVCSLCSISFTSSQDLRNHQNEQHPDNPYAKTKPPNENQISSKRRCIEAGTTYYSPTLPGPYTTHRDSSLSTTSQEPSTLESTNDPLA